MKTRYSLLLLLVAVGFWLSCGPGKVPDEAADRCYPEDLRVEVNSHMMDISWKNNCDQLISGYNIYISDEPLAAAYPGANLPGTVVPFNPASYSGDTNPDDGVEHFIAERLENGRKYYVSVRTVYPDRTLSTPSDELIAVCGPRGEIELSIRYKSNQDGFSFEQNQYVRADDSSNDLVFYSKEGEDYIDAPSRLNGFIKANRIRKTSLSGSFDEIRRPAARLEGEPTKVRVAVEKGDWLWVRTPDGTNALVKVLDIHGAGSDRKIRLFFAYSPLAGEMLF